MQDLMQLNPAIKLRLGLAFFGALCFSSGGSSMTLYYNKNLGSAVTGALLIVSAVMVFIIGLYAGHVVDRYGRRPVMVGSTILSMIGGGLATLANSPWLFSPWLTFGGFMVLDFAYGFFQPASQAQLVDLTTPDNRRAVYSLQYWVINFAVLIGSALSGWLFRDYLVFLLLGITIEELLAGLVIFFFVEESFHPDLHKDEIEHNIFKAYRIVAKDKTFMYFIFGSIFISMIFSQPDYYLPVHLSDSFQTAHIFGFEIYGQRMLSLTTLINTLMIVLMMTSVNRWTKNWQRRRGVLLGTLLLGGGIVIAFIGSQLSVEVLAAIILTVGEMIIVPVTQALRADLMDGAMVGTYTGAFSVTQPIANVLSGLLVSISGILGHNGVAGVMLVVMLLAAFPIVKAVRMFELRVQ